VKNNFKPYLVITVLVICIAGVSYYDRIYIPNHIPEKNITEVGLRYKEIKVKEKEDIENQRRGLFKTKITPYGV